ncbi:MAG TPA: DUF971 domain-containing protein [Verrucomicrobiota bacterium]|nr:DUF971 domain-containing protein [Verrucomicrobiota bacterium]
MISPLQMDLVAEELAIRWNDGTEQFISLEDLRKKCPCAWCEKNAIAPSQVQKDSHSPLYSKESYQIRSIVPVGGYALQLTWGDGHASGIYSYDYLRKIQKN